MGIPTGNKVSGDDFFDRKHELEDLKSDLQDNHIVLSGPRRLGKSSLLERLAVELTEQGFLVRVIDIQDKISIEDFIDRIDAEFPKSAIEHYLNKLTTSVTQWLQRLKRLDVKGPGGISAGIELQNTSELSWHDKALALQQRLSPAPLCIFIDEFSVFLDKLIQQDRQQAEYFLDWLRAWRLNNANHCRMIFSGSIGLNYLLERHQLSARFNDCYDFVLGPFKPPSAKTMLQTHIAREQRPESPDAVEYLCQRIGWLAPFYLNLLLHESLRAARDREDESNQAKGVLLTQDVDDGYERLISARSRFNHWHQRLIRDLAPDDLTFYKAVLAALAKTSTGLTRKQLLARLNRIENNAEQRQQKLEHCLLKLEEDGYLGHADNRIQFLSFLVRDYWQRNHV
ncbi:ATP-binding protein [Methylocucumis oryzae]|uniref:ATP-binding protein n=1 Tax=Methylocucumis oryzae TaxID=1632867 RepID=A0A0F3IH54_9GAMM|nr:ATP-binding protein [Methylocucumis oryzae]KJV06042.1 hypothetical protein VZ94_13820 [Methylocucumis oryzae]